MKLKKKEHPLGSFVDYYQNTLCTVRWVENVNPHKSEQLKRELEAQLSKVLEDYGITRFRIDF